MDDFTDDEELPPQSEVKHAAKSSENDQDKLLASPDEQRDEYTGKLEYNIYKILILIKTDNS